MIFQWLYLMISFFAVYGVVNIYFILYVVSQLIMIMAIVIAIKP